MLIELLTKVGLIRLSEEECWVDEHRVSLSPMERAILEVFLQNPNRVLTQEYLIDHAWGEGQGSYLISKGSGTFKVTYNSLQRKIERDGVRAVKTLIGVGYIMKSLDPLPAGQSDVIELGLLKLDVGQHECWFGPELIHLGKKQFRCIVKLARHAGREVSREALAAAIWTEEADQTSVTNRTAGVTDLVVSLRARLKEVKINAVRSHSYRLEIM